jgi:hypothetical protein
MFPRTPATHKWYAIFASAAGDAAVEVEPEGDLLARFEMAILLGRVGRHSIRAMWMIDEATDQVSRIHGPVPSTVAKRHHGKTSKKPPASSLSLEQTSPRTGRRGA